MKHLRYLLFAILIALPLTACAYKYQPTDYRPYTVHMCFVDNYSGYNNCGWYSYDAYRYYHGFLSYRYYNGRHHFYHFGWRNPAGGYLVPANRFKEDPGGSMVKGKGYTRGGNAEGRTAKPRDPPAGRNQPKASQPDRTRTAKPRGGTEERVVPSRNIPQTRSAIPKRQTIKRTPRPKVKPRGGRG